ARGALQLFPGRLEIENRGANVVVDLGANIFGLGAPFAELGVRLHQAPLRPAAFEDPTSALAGHVVGRQRRAPRQTDRAVVGADFERRQAFALDGSPRRLGGADSFQSGPGHRPAPVGAVRPLSRAARYAGRSL